MPVWVTWVIQWKGDPIKNIRALFSAESFFSLDQHGQVSQLNHCDPIIRLISKDVCSYYTDYADPFDTGDPR